MRWTRVVENLLEEDGGLGDVQRRGRHQSTKRLGRRPPNDIWQAEFSMKLWGLDPEHSKSDKVFCETIQKAISDFKTGMAFGRRFDGILPHEPDGTETPEQLCHREMEIQMSKPGDKMVVEVDVLKELVPNLPSIPPYFWNAALEQKEVRREFARFTAQELNPLCRFMSREDDAAVILQEKFLGSDHQACKGACHAVYFRAAAIHTACFVKEIRCCACGEKGTLRWNRGKRTEWSRMDCSKCGSLYEVKAKNKLRRRSRRKLMPPRF